MANYKLYFYSSFFIFIFLTLDLKKTKYRIININYIPLILLLIFPLYKFSVNSDGLNRVDSFPSALNKELKLNYKWSELLTKNKECNKLEISEKNNTAKIIFLNIIVIIILNINLLIIKINQLTV